MNRRTLFMYLIGLLLFVVFLYFFNIDLSAFANMKNPSFFALSTLAFLLSTVVLAKRFEILLSSIEESSVGLKNLAKLEFINKFVYYTLPSRLNIPVKALILYKIHKVQKGNAISVAGFEYALDVFSLIFLSVLGFLFLFKGEVFDAIWIYPLWIGMGIVAGLISALIFFKIPVAIFDRGLQFIENSKLPALLKRLLNIGVRFVKKIRETWKDLILGKHIASVLFLMAINWILVAIAMVGLFQVFGVWIDPATAILVVASALLLGGLSQIPGGLGVRDGSMIFLFSVVGMDVNIATAAVILKRGIDFLVIILGYLFSLKLTVNFFDMNWMKK